MINSNSDVEWLTLQLGRTRSGFDHRLPAISAVISTGATFDSAADMRQWISNLDPALAFSREWPTPESRAAWDAFAYRARTQRSRRWTAGPRTWTMSLNEQIASRRGLASDQFQPDRRRPVEESSSAARDARSDHEPELVDDAAGQRRLGDRDAAVHANVASRTVLQAR